MGQTCTYASHRTRPVLAATFKGRKVPRFADTVRTLARVNRGHQVAKHHRREARSNYSEQVKRSKGLPLSVGQSGLESRCGLRVTMGSNPIPSATKALVGYGFDGTFQIGVFLVFGVDDGGVAPPSPQRRPSGARSRLLGFGGSVRGILLGSRGPLAEESRRTRRDGLTAPNVSRGEHSCFKVVSEAVYLASMH